MKMLDILKKKYILVLIGVVVAIFVLIFVFINNRTGSGNSFAVARGNLVEKVLVSGKTKALSSVNLGFEKAGKVAKANVEVGAKVKPGDILVELDTSELNASLLQAEANLDAENARLAEIARGSRPDEILAGEASVSSAKSSLSSALNDFQNALSSIYSKSDDVVRNQIDQLFSGGRTGSAQFTAGGFNSSSINSDRNTIESWLVDWQNEKPKVASGEIGFDTFVSMIKIRVNLIRSFLDNISFAVADKDLATRTIASGARTDFSAAVLSFLSYEEKYNTAKRALEKAGADYNVIKNGNTPEAIQGQRSKVAQMQAQVANVLAQIKNSKIISPIEGVVTLQDLKPGEIIAPNQTLVSVISNNSFEIEANISEINIGKINIGNKVKITFDAFTGVELSGTVSYVDPAETLVDGVVNYKVKIAFNADTISIKNGLTTNLEIETNNREGVLFIPQYFVTKKSDGKSYVMKIINGRSIETIINTGLLGSDGNVEVVSGLSLGDKVVQIGTK